MLIPEASSLIIIVWAEEYKRKIKSQSGIYHVEEITTEATTECVTDLDIEI